MWTLEMLRKWENIDELTKQMSLLDESSNNETNDKTCNVTNKNKNKNTNKGKDKNQNTNKKHDSIDLTKL